MHIQKEDLHPGAARKEAIARSRTTLTMTPETKGVLRRMGNGSMSDTVSVILSVLVRQSDSNRFHSNPHLLPP